MDYEPVIGLEVHVQLNTASKMFCGCSTKFDAPPNTNVCPVCLGMPGVLPVPNRAAIEMSVMVGLALDCEIASWSKQDRKNYFYPDLAKNYQISQYDLPLNGEGHIDIVVNDEPKRVRITRAHIEEDTARNVHTVTGGFSGVDFNRCGVPLLEIVTEPDIHSADEAYAYLTALKQILEYLGVSDCNMEEGSLRAEPNISLRPRGETALGTKTEVKNVASFSGVHKAIDYEIARQKKILSDGGAVQQETRGWDPDRGITIAQRQKESAHDYRYFPDPDLAPIVIDDAWREDIRSRLPELPMARKARFESEHGLNDYDAGVLTATKAMADYFEAAVKAGADSKPAANWIQVELIPVVAAIETTFDQCPVSPGDLAGLLGLIADGTISGKIAKDVLPEMIESGKAPKAIVEEKGLVQISDSGAIEAIVVEVIAANPGPVGDLRSGKGKAKGFLVGQVMKASQGKANPKIVNELIDKHIAT